MTSLAAFTEETPLVLLGGGKMGSAMLYGWLRGGLDPRAAVVIDPQPSDELRTRATDDGFAIIAEPGAMTPRAVVLAVKPQIMPDALPPLAACIGAETLVISIAAGKPISFFEAQFVTDTPIVRAMPNTPAAVGRGITALVANPQTSAENRTLSQTLMSAVGEVVWIDDEAQMDAVTGVSGSGPAYVFHMIEALAHAGESAGLSPGTALALARQTVIGAAELTHQTGEDAAVLRKNVTSPGGTTAAGLEVLMAEPNGLKSLMKETVAAATQRGRDLAS